LESISIAGIRSSLPERMRDFREADVETRRQARFPPVVERKTRSPIKWNRWLPTCHLSEFRAVPNQHRHVGGPQQVGLDFDVPPVSHYDSTGGRLCRAECVGRASRGAGAPH
jgi:hypothetical protein